MSNNQEFELGNESSIDPIRVSIWGAIMLWIALWALAFLAAGMFCVLIVFR